MITTTIVIDLGPRTLNEKTDAQVTGIGCSQKETMRPLRTKGRRNKELIRGAQSRPRPQCTRYEGRPAPSKLLRTRP